MKEIKILICDKFPSRAKTISNRLCKLIAEHKRKIENELRIEKLKKEHDERIRYCVKFLIDKYGMLEPCEINSLIVRELRQFYSYHDDEIKDVIKELYP